jgi:subtilisin family serine protease
MSGAKAIVAGRCVSRTSSPDASGLVRITVAAGRGVDATGMAPSYGRPALVKALPPSPETLVQRAVWSYRGSSGVEGGLTMERSVRAGRGLVVRSVLVVVATLLAATLAPSVAGAGPGADATPVRAIVTFKARPDAAARNAVQAAGGSVRRTFTLINGMAISIPARAMAGLRHNPLVASVELDATITTMEPAVQTESTGDLEYDNAWGVTHIGSKAAHDAGIRGSGVKVAVIDTGIDYIHDDPDDTPYVVDPEFNSNYRGGYDFVNHDADPMDDNGHGTHVAGILAAEKNGYLVVGVAPQIDLYGLKILDANGSGYESDAISALQWAVDNGMDVVNMSFGTHTNVVAFQTAVANAAAAGLLMVAASGNVDPSNWQEVFYGCPVAYPGAYPQVLSTTFTNPNDALTGYSCTGPEVDFASPGDNIFSPVPVGSCMLCSDYGYMALSGTSMASPHLAGSVALLLSAGITDQGSPGLFDDVRNRLCATANQGWGVQTAYGGGTAIPPSDPRYAQYFGCGVVDAGEAVLGVAPPSNRPPVANSDGASTSEDTAVDIAVLANDTDPDGDSLTLSSVGAASHGATSANPGGTVHYVPAANYNGADTFTYVVSDGRGGTATGTVNLTVTAVNDPPVAVNDSATTTAGTAVTISVLANDTDIDSGSLTVAGVSDPPHGTAVANANGTITYTPDPGYSGSDAFGYTASDGSAVSNVATVSITINPAPPPTTFHIGDLDALGSKTGKTWTAKVTIRVEDASHAPLSGVVVTGGWSNGASGSVSCTTTTAGTCSVQKTKLAGTVSSVTFTVTGATRSGYTYTPAANHDPDTDSTDGTSIIVNRPA